MLNIFVIDYVVNSILATYHNIMGWLAGRLGRTTWISLWNIRHIYEKFQSCRKWSPERKWNRNYFSQSYFGNKNYEFKIRQLIILLRTRFKKFFLDILTSLLNLKIINFILRGNWNCQGQQDCILFIWLLLTKLETTKLQGAFCCMTAIHMFHTTPSLLPVCKLDHRRQTTRGS